MQTVDRSFFVRSEASPGPSCDQIGATRKKRFYRLRLDHTDRLRFEVAFPFGQELFSWMDSGRFEALNLNELIDYGPNASGAFGAYLAEIFGSTGNRFQYRSQEGNLLEYGFYVPAESSHNLLKGAGQWRPTAYDGTISINMQTLDVERLTVETADLRPETGLCAAETILDYQEAGSDNGRLSLPRESRTRFVLREAHQEIENLTTFSDCREVAVRAVPLPPVPAALPDNLRVTLEPITPIDTDKSAGGDPVVARVAEDVRGEIPGRPGSGQRPGELYLAHGSIVRGRIGRIEHHLAPARFMITLVFETVATGGTERSFEVRLDRPPIHFAPYEPTIPGLNIVRSEQTLDLRTPENRVVVPAGSISYWRTRSIAAASNRQDPSAGAKR